MTIKIVFFGALVLSGLHSSATKVTDTLSSATRTKYLKPVKIGPGEYFLPPLVLPKIDSVLLRKLAIDESYKNRKAREITVNFYRNIQKLSAQLYGLEVYPVYTSAESLESLLNSSKYAGDRRTQLLVQNSLGQYYIGKGNLDKAAGYLQGSLAIKEMAGDKPGVLLIMSGLAGIARLNGKYEEAIAYQQVMLQANIAARKNLPIANSYLALAGLKSQQGQYAEAEKLIMKKALPTFRGNKEGRLSCFEQLSSLYYQQNRYSESKWYSLQAKNIADQLNLSEAQVASLSRLASIKNIEGDREHALQDLKAAETLALRNNYTERLMEIKGDMGDIYRKMGNYVVAGSFINEFSELSKNIRDIER